ncbi:YnhF family membrane protein [Photobacterium lipolyticum]|uniref:YnhF family membrane protein n=1 Tax=Photobacterium lipolyticum TaxID=266810 RepID=A0A2T3MUW9_9GAMM|nr:YnhF family membrane protein [Photobacterium lipolyticum]
MDKDLKFAIIAAVVTFTILIGFGLTAITA